MKDSSCGVLAGLLAGLLVLMLAGCGSTDSTPQRLADPTNQLPQHFNWGAYNLYRYEPGPNGRWIKIVSLGILQETPVLGDRPVLLTHGLGGSIRNDQLVPMAQNLFDNNLASSVFGFEYDTQDGIAANGVFYRQALGLLNSSGPPGLNWTLICHSMGGLVARAALQAGPLPIAASGNRFITLGTPHLGSPMAGAVQNAGVAAQAAVIFQLDQGGFTNADGNPSEVDLLSQGFTDLRTDSLFLAALNVDMGNHPQARFFTVAGTDEGNLREVNDLLGVTTDDGLVTVASANPAALGAVDSGLAPVSHTELDMDAATVFPLIRRFMGE